MSRRVVGLETEYGVTGAQSKNSEALSVAAAQAVRAWQATLCAAPEPVSWDWEGENPLRDLRGTTLDRASAPASLLTDDPQHFAPSANDSEIDADSLRGRSSPLLTNALLTNGGRFYVDHAHPEYSTPETSSTADAVLWDAAGEIIARKAMEYAHRAGHDIVLYKNNTDSKGSAYGSHENYQIPREIPFEILRDFLIPFLVTRPVICGAGRVGLGANSSQPGFQISQRADFVADLVGLQTTFNRPIVNTRDEPHASNTWRRLHVINGDANRFQGSIAAKVASTRAWLAALETAWRLHQAAPPFEGLFISGDCVEAVWQVSRDTDFSTRLTCADGRERSAREWQYEAANLTAEYLAAAPEKLCPDEALDDAATWVNTAKLLLEESDEAGRYIEWVAKRQLFSAFAARCPSKWEDAKLVALDIRWADLREGASPIDKMAHLIHTPYDQEALAAAALNPPATTRAQLRGRAVRERQDLVAASWNSLVFQADNHRLMRCALPDPQFDA